jgi:preprotein translocase subunit SecF
MTSLTILTPLVILVAFGPDVIFGFSVAMAFGIFVGSYSSVYQAAPILIWLKVTQDSFVPDETVKDSKAEQLNEGVV